MSGVGKTGGFLLLQLDDNNNLRQYQRHHLILSVVFAQKEILSVMCDFIIFITAGVTHSLNLYTNYESFVQFNVTVK